MTRHDSLRATWSEGQRWETRNEDSEQWVPVGNRGFSEPVWDERQEYRRVEEAATAAPDPLGYATRLAESIWRKHYQQDAPDWKPLPDLLGVLTQIDNMTAGLMKKPDGASGLPVPRYSGWLWTHVVKGGDYRMLGEAKLQTDKPLTDMAEVVVYQGADGKLWARERHEYEARFSRTRPDTSGVAVGDHQTSGAHTPGGKP